MKYRSVIVIVLCLALFCSACRGTDSPAADTTNPTAPQPTDPPPSSDPTPSGYNKKQGHVAK